MDTNKDEAVKLAEEAVNEVAKKEQEDKIKEVSTKIEELLKESKMALQPILDQSQFGILPRVVLVNIPEQPTEPKVDGKADDK